MKYDDLTTNYTKTSRQNIKTTWKYSYHLPPNNSVFRFVRLFGWSNRFSHVFSFHWISILAKLPNNFQIYLLSQWWKTVFVVLFSLLCESYLCFTDHLRLNALLLSSIHCPLFFSILSRNFFFFTCHRITWYVVYNIIIPLHPHIISLILCISCLD